MRPTGRRRPRLVAAAVTALATAAVGLSLDGADVWRQVVAGVFALGAPAAAFAACWPGRDLLGRVAIGVAGSLSVVVAVSQVLVMSGTWSKAGGTTGAGFAAVLVWLAAAAAAPSGAADPSADEVAPVPTAAGRDVSS